MSLRRSFTQQINCPKDKVQKVKIIALFFLVFVVATPSASAQKKFRETKIWRYASSILNDTSEASKATFIVYPTFASSPETGLQIGASLLRLFYAKKDTLNRLSELQAFPFFTIKGQYGIIFENAIYGNEDKWFFLGETKIQRFPLSYYGVGPVTSGNDPAYVDAFQLLLKQRVLRKIHKNFFFGPEVDYQLLSNVTFKQPSDGNLHEIPLGGDGTQNLGFGLGFVYDSRHNVLNVRKGLFGEIAYLTTVKGFGSEYGFGGVNLDVRSYHPVGKNSVLAWQVKGQFMHGDVPFNQLALLGGDRLMRGYYLGRYRDKNLIAAQLEYRMLPFPFSKRFGAVAFVSAGTVAPDINSFQIKRLRVACGVGFRFLVFPKKDIYIRLDFGFTKEGLNFYVFNGEAF
ncbi:MAG: BamA/TamA family outer membrane protein [Crocinitomicaceae bacterium]|nr:BamA/TamA family outer membrane protein [Crocinitomicaceae bacterium]